MTNKKVYIVILNYNEWQDTIECLESVLKSDYKNYQVIVVDNNSPNNSMNYLIKWAKGEIDLWLPDTNPLKNMSFPLKGKPIEYILYTKKEAEKGGNEEKENKLKNPIIFIQAEENKGFAAGNNIGIKYAFAKNDFEYIWLLNNDTVIEKDTLKKFVISMNENKNIGLLGSVQYYYNNPNKIQAIGGGFNKLTANFWNYQSLKNIEKVYYVYGASMFFRKECFKRVGLLNEEYFLYYEEIDLAERIKNSVFRQKVDKNIKIFHKHSGTISKKGNVFREYFLEKNKILFYKKYYKPLILIPILKVLKKYLLSFDKKYLKIIKEGILK